jgi:N-ethylmaleimide reductase
MNTTSNLKLFTPENLGAIQLKHRVVMAPLTRSRASLPGNAPNGLMAEYYGQRASDGGLIIGEATNISASSRGWLGAPGLFTDEQVAGWRKVIAAVHAKGGKMVAQLLHTGRASHIDVSGTTPVSASVNPSYWQNPDHLVSAPSGWVRPSPHRALALEEIPAIIEDYRCAAGRAKDADFEGVELHAANGYLIDQFLQDNSNHRTDQYGGSVENRARILLELVTALVSVWGEGRVAVRIGPAGKWNDMNDSDPNMLFTYIAEQLNRFNLAYLHIVEPRVKGNIVVNEGQDAVASEQLRKIFKGKIVSAGGFEPETAKAIVESGNADAVAFGRHFISNPDLPQRIQESLPLTPYDRNTFYTFDARGYIDYAPYAEVAV